MSECYDAKGAPLKCRHCGSEQIKSRTMDFIDFGVPGGGPPTEVEYACVNCKQVVGYWAYGYYDPWYAEHAKQPNAHEWDDWKPGRDVV